MKAVYYERAGSFSIGACDVRPPDAGEVRLDVAYCGVCGTDLHIAHGGMDHRVVAPQVIGHEMSGTVAELGPGVDGFEVGDPVVVRPIDARGETAADKGVSHICRALKVLGIDTPGAFQASWTVPAFTLHKLPDDLELRLAALAEPLAVACHDVRRGQVVAGETAVVIGGGPIGLLIGLVARERGARVVLSEVNPFRLELASMLGFDAVNPSETDVPAHVQQVTAGAGADVVFEVSGSAGGVRTMTELCCLRGRIVIVAIFPDPSPVKLFDFFSKELTMVGARLYELDDYDRAIGLLAGGRLPLDELITAVEPLDRLPTVFEELSASPRTMKVLIDCQA